MPKEYIDRKALPLKRFAQTAQMFQDDIIAAIDTDFMLVIAVAENKELFEIINAVRKAPIDDVVEVTRCRDCKHRYVPTRCALWYATVDDKEYFVERGDDFYCSYGERKDK